MEERIHHSYDSKPEGKPSRKAAIFRAVWRWHFYAGIFTAPFLIVLAISGGLYLFKPQIEATLYQEHFFIESGSEGKPALTLGEQTEAASREFGEGASILSVKQYDDPLRTTELSYMENGTMMYGFINPYTGGYQGSLAADETFSSIFKRVHSEWFAGGTFVNLLVELAACWTLILVLTGLYLWWPKKKSQIWGTVLPRFGKKGRVFWRDLHAVPAFWLSIFITILILTGLPWTSVVGEQINKLATAANSYPQYALSFGPKPESVLTTKDVIGDGPWATENMEVPASAGSGNSKTLDEINQAADRNEVQKPYTISLPQGEKGVYTLATSHTKPGDNATLNVDQYSGEVLSDVRFADYGLIAKAITVGIALHEGRLFGLANQILGAITCLGIVLMVFSSFVMWRKRKPKGTFGAPAAMNDAKVKWGVIAILAVLGILMPLVGLSILIIVIIDFMVLSLRKRNEGTY
ncbi:PepSY-associated TM helix domain-containing protein [Rossellomorea vietnamensis]|uniref:PepSY-associated TM helix domain-containing protein n=1 Tax=Rossellomorea vietnamensis TaxID=218284 RepID=UPI003CE997FD